MIAKCPLMQSACQLKDCPWWDSKVDRCSVPEIARWLREIDTSLQQLIQELNS